MSGATSIQWTDKTWNPTVGCSAVSPGCTNCYAQRVAWRLKHSERYQGLTRATRHGPVWNGNVRCVPEVLDDPLHWHKPCRIFVNSMSDLFHEDVPFEFIDSVFVRMARAKQHVYQILTKRPARMAEYMRQRSQEPHILSLYCAKYQIDPIGDEIQWPLSNVWLGVSVENQATANERIPLLLRTPAAVRFLSVEPLLELIDLSQHLAELPIEPQWFGGPTADKSSPLQWVIIGGESGPHARPCDVDWIRSIIAQCRTALVPVFVKQLGSKYVPDGRESPAYWFLGDRKGGDPAEWPADLQIREWPK